MSLKIYELKELLAAPNTTEKEALRDELKELQLGAHSLTGI